MGFLGFKLYPPNGIRPVDNGDVTIEARLHEFFRYCIRRKIPVLAHCNPNGTQAFKQSGLYGEPDSWRRLLEQPAFRKMRVCLGHAGGGRHKSGGRTFPGWYAKNQAEWDDGGNWARKVVKLCEDFPNVFCEVAYLHELVRSVKNRERFAANFTRALSGSTGEFPFDEKCMYGSDAHMPEVSLVTAEFLEVFRSVFPSQGSFDNFCCGNATRFLRI